MTNVSCPKTWERLLEGFVSLGSKVASVLPDVTIEYGCSHNEALLFRAYVELSHKQCHLDISFDAWCCGRQIHISGDIAREDGIIVAEVVNVSFSNSTDVDTLMTTYATELAVKCELLVSFIVDYLSSREAKWSNHDS